MEASVKKIVVLLVSVCLFSTSGCASIAEGMLRSALGIKKSDEDRFTRRRKEERKLKEQRKWIQYWRDHPTENPAMTEAFNDDYR
jgi:hypothetical protein